MPCTAALLPVTLWKQQIHIQDKWDRQTHRVHPPKSILAHH